LKLVDAVGVRRNATSQRWQLSPKDAFPDASSVGLNPIRLHHIGIDHRWANTVVLMLMANLQIRVIATADGQLIRELTLDTSRDYQPQNPKTPPANH
jgi:hypothetical protein